MLTLRTFPRSAYSWGGGSCVAADGITPSLLRLPFVAFYHGGMTSLFILAAFTATLAFVILLADEIWRQIEAKLGVKSHQYYRLALAGITGAVVGPGTLMWHELRPAMYEEAIAWTAAFTIAAIWLFVRWVRTRGLAELAGIVVFGVLAANSRGTGIVPPIIIGILIVWVALVERRAHRPLEIALGAVIAILPAASMYAVLYSKFGTVNIDQIIMMHEQTRAAIRGGFPVPVPGLQYVPTQVWAYLRPNSLYFATTKSGLEIRPNIDTVPMLPPLRDRNMLHVEPTPSITVIATAALVLTVIGLLSPWWFRRFGLNASRIREQSGILSLGRSAPWLVVGVLVAAGSGLSALFMFPVVSGRYIGDFWPLLATGTCFGAAALMGVASKSLRLKLVLLLMLAATAGASAFLNLASVT